MAHLTSLLNSTDGVLVELHMQECSRPRREGVWASIVSYAFAELAPDAAILQTTAMANAPDGARRAIAELVRGARTRVRLRGMRGWRLSEFDEQKRSALTTAGTYMRAVSLLHGGCEVAGASDYGDMLALLTTTTRWPSLAETLQAGSFVASMTEIDLSACDDENG